MRGKRTAGEEGKWRAIGTVREVYKNFWGRMEYSLVALLSIQGVREGTLY